jgi:hypothetical protein
MAGLAYVQARVDAASDRLDNIISQQERRERQRLAEESAEQERAAAEKARWASERKRQIQASYADAFTALGSECPMSVDDETPGRFRRKLYDALRHKLAPDHELASIRSDEVSASPEVFGNFEVRLLEAARQEAASPSEANLPADGSLVSRNRVDNSTNERSVTWHGRESFIKTLGRHGRKVTRIVHRPTMSVLWGTPLNKAD